MALQNFRVQDFSCTLALGGNGMQHTAHMPAVGGEGRDYGYLRRLRTCRRAYVCQPA